MSNIFSMTDTWNAGATTFTAVLMNVTDTSSTAGSNLLDLQVGGVSKASVNKAGYFRTAGFTVAALPAAATAGAGARAYVTDGSVVAAGNFGTIVAGGGANGVPVYSDGTNWRIG